MNLVESTHPWNSCLVAEINILLASEGGFLSLYWLAGLSSLLDAWGTPLEKCWLVKNFCPCSAGIFHRVRAPHYKMVLCSIWAWWKAWKVPLRVANYNGRCQRPSISLNTSYFPTSKRNSTIPQSSSIAGTSPSDCLVSYQDTRGGGGLTPLQRCSQYIRQPQPTGQSIFWIGHVWVSVCNGSLQQNDLLS